MRYSNWSPDSTEVESFVVERKQLKINIEDVVNNMGVPSEGEDLKLSKGMQRRRSSRKENRNKPYCSRHTNTQESEQLLKKSWCNKSKKIKDIQRNTS